MRCGKSIETFLYFVQKQPFNLGEKKILLGNLFIYIYIKNPVPQVYLWKKYRTNTEMTHVQILEITN